MGAPAGATETLGAPPSGGGLFRRPRQEPRGCVQAPPLLSLTSSQARTRCADGAAAREAVKCPPMRRNEVFDRELVTVAMRMLLKAAVAHPLFGRPFDPPVQRSSPRPPQARSSRRRRAQDR